MPKHCHSLARRHLAPEGAARMHCVVYSSYIAGVTFGILLHARRYGRSLLAVALWPFVRHKSEFCQKGWTDSAVFCFFFSSTYPSLCFKEMWNFLKKNKMHSSGTLSNTLDYIENFPRHVYRCNVLSTSFDKDGRSV